MKKTSRKKQKSRGFRRAVLTGLGVVAPSLLTIVILLAIFNTVQKNVLNPVESLVKHSIYWATNDTKTKIPDASIVDEVTGAFTFEGNTYIPISGTSGPWIPEHVYKVANDSPGASMSRTGRAFYMRYIELRYLKRYVVVPLFIVTFVMLLYLLGRFLAYRIGRALYTAVERIISRLPIIRTVYSSVKQVTDFVFTENDLDFNRVVAVEYPRKGIWSLGFVTGESMIDIRDAANEPVISVLMATSPMPATGFTITVRKSETVELDITIDQAFQFIVSCGVVVPVPQRQDEITRDLHDAIEGQISSKPGNKPIESA